MTVAVLAPYSVLPISLYNVGHSLLELRITVLRCQFPSHLTIDHITTTFHCYTTALEVFRAAVLLLILALRSGYRGVLVTVLVLFE